MADTALGEALEKAGITQAAYQRPAPLNVVDDQKPASKRGKARHASRLQVVQIHQHLTDYTRNVSEGVCEFIDGWSDEKIASTVGASVWSVRNHRSELFGRLYIPPKNSDEIAELWRCTNRLNEQLRDIEKRLEMLERNTHGGR